MTQPEAPRGEIRHLEMVIFVVAIVAIVILVAFSWHATSGRITALETQLQGLEDTLDQRLPVGDWREELGRTTKPLESRVDDHIRSERRRLTAELDAGVKALATNAAASTPTFEEHGSRVETFAPAGGEVVASERALDSATDSELELPWL